MRDPARQRLLDIVQIGMERIHQQLIAFDMAGGLPVPFRRLLLPCSAVRMACCISE